MRKKGLWKKTASVLIAAAMIMTSVPVYAAGTDESVEEIVVQESTEFTEIEERTLEPATVGPDYSWYTNATTAESYSISTAAQLLGLANIVNGTTGDANIAQNTFGGKTISLTNNVSLAGIEWKPIGTVVSYSGIAFGGTFDGGNYTISDLNTSDNTQYYATAGLFGSITGKATVKNLKLENVNVASTHYAGALVGYISEAGAKIENCHVSGGTITSTPEWLEEKEKYDNGDKVGGIIGYCTQDDITGCTVENITIQGYRDIGGIAGCTSGTFRNNEVKGNVNLIVDTENGYKDSVKTTVGLIAGRRESGATFDENNGQLESITYRINGEVPFELVNYDNVIADGAATVNIIGVGKNPKLIMKESYCGWLEFGEAVLNVSNLTLQDDRDETSGEPSSWPYIPIVVKGKTFNASNCIFNESISVSGVEEASLDDCDFNDKKDNHYSIWAGTSGLKEPENYDDALKKLTVKNCRFNQTARGIKVGASGDAEILIEGNTFDSLVKKPAVNLASVATVTMNDNTYTNMTKGLWAIENGGTVVGSDTAKVVSTKTDDKGETTYYDYQITDAIAKVENMYYDSLQKAVNDAAEGSTVAMQNDTDISSSGLIIDKDKTVTLDLNGHNIKVANTPEGQIAVTGSLTLQDSTADGQTGVGRGKIYTETDYAGASTGYTLIDALNGGKFIMESGYIYAVRPDAENKGQFAVGVGGKDSSVTINGGKIEAGWYAVSGNGTDLAGTAIIVNAGTLISTADYAIYHPQAGTLTVNGGVVYGAAGGICMNRGSLEVNNGTITSKGIGDTGNWGDGTGGLINAAIALNARYGDVIASIAGGSILAEGNGVTIQKGDNPISLELSGGIFTFKDDEVENYSSYLAAGYETAKISDNTYQVVPKTLDKKDAIESATAVVKNANEQSVAEDVAVTIDGYTLKVAGKISDGNKVELTYNSVFGATGSVEITKSGDAFSAFPLTIILEEGVEYKVDVSGLETLPKNTILQSAGVETKVDNSLKGEEKEAADALANKLGQKDAVTTTGLAAVASEKITGDGTVSTSQGEIKTTDDVVQKKFEEENINTTGGVQLVVSPYLDIQITAVDTDTSSNKQTVTLNITPMYVVKATTAATAKDMVEEGVDTNTVTITEPQPLTVNETVTITLPLPDVFTDATPIYVKHKKENGRTYYYVTTISGDGKEISFVNPNGFSDFTLEQDGREGWIDFEGVGIVKYNLSKMGDNLPTPTAPSGKYFINWTITDGNKNYTTNVLTDELLTAINDKTLTAAPNFGTYPSGPSTPQVTSVTISGISVEDKVYDGKEAAYAGTPSAVASDGTAVTIAASDYTYTWYNEDGTVLTAAPKDAGEYKLVVGVNNGTYTGSQTVAFKITKKEVTASIDDKTMVQGEAVPELTVSYDGFVGTDSKDNALEVQAELTTEADGKTAGEYDIIFKTQPMLNNTAGKNYTLKYADKGTLKVEEKKVSAPQVLFAKASAGKNSVKLSWNKISGAEGYLIYGSRCGNSFKLLKKVSAKTLSYEKTKLAKGVFYKFYVAAYKTVDGEREVIVKSPQLHVTTKGGKYGNPTAVTVSKESVTVAKGKTTKVTAKVSKTDGKVKYHIAQIRYLSTNKKVATVTSKGTIKGVGKGTCYVYCYTQNGVVKKVKVTVK